MSVADTVCALIAGASAPSAVCGPYAVSVPYSNRQVVKKSHGLTRPANVASVSPIPDALPVDLRREGTLVGADVGEAVQAARLALEIQGPVQYVVDASVERRRTSRLAQVPSGRIHEQRAAV